MALPRLGCLVQTKFGTQLPKGCAEKHSKHYCRFCGDRDSDHRSTYCPTQTPAVQLRCRVNEKYGNSKPKGCSEKHTTHFCKQCGNVDADHRSAFCKLTKAAKSTRTNQHGPRKRCRVNAKDGDKAPNGCSENHSKHRCRLCGDKDSDHRAKNCTAGIELCHGTKMENIAGISKDGLFPSKQGRLGAGIYFTEEQYAKEIAKFRGQGKGHCVIYCTVNLGKAKDVGNGDDSNGSWANNGYDSCKSMHPKWAGINTSFPEYCLKDKKKCRICKVELVDVVIDGDINLENAEIVLKGKCQFKGKIIAGLLETQ